MNWLDLWLASGWLVAVGHDDRTIEADSPSAQVDRRRALASSGSAGLTRHDRNVEMARWEATAKDRTAPAALSSCP
jgi:hypothetical protein